MAWGLFVITLETYLIVQTIRGILDIKDRHDYYKMMEEMEVGNDMVFYKKDAKEEGFEK